MGAENTEHQELVDALQQLRNERRLLRYKLSKTQAKFEKHTRELRALEAEIAGLTHRIYASGAPMRGAARLGGHEPQAATPAGAAPADSGA